MPAFKFLLILVATLCVTSVHSDVELELTASTDLAMEGFITLSWKDPDDRNGHPPVHLQVATDNNFHHLVRDLTLHAQQQVHLTGFPDGIYFARLLDPQGRSLTNSTHFEVRHRDLQTAWILFSVGFALFIFLLFVFTRFTRQKKNK